MGNLDLWLAVEKTDPAHVRPITGKAYQGTSPKPHYLVRKATETFGPCGIGWGFTVDERIEDGAMIEPGFFERMHIAKVKVWYKWGEARGEVEHIGGTPFSGRRKDGKIFTDEDAPKKSVTDALVKALSMIGFAGDIFMGRYDDSKYVSDLKREIADAGAPDLISSEQVAELHDIIGKIGKPDAEKNFMAYFKIENLGDLPARDFGRAVSAIKAKVPRS